MKLTKAAVIAGLACSLLTQSSTGPVEHIETSAVCTYDDMMLVFFNLERASHHDYEWVQDDGAAQLWVWEVSGRSHGGQWLKVPTLSGGEGALRFDVGKFTREGGHFTEVRVSHGEWRSSPKPTDFNCEKNEF